MRGSLLDIFETKGFGTCCAAAIALAAFAPFHGWRALIPTVLTAAAYWISFRDE